MPETSSTKRKTGRRWALIALLLAGGAGIAGALVYANRDSRPKPDSTGLVFTPSTVDSATSPAGPDSVKQTARYEIEFIDDSARIERRLSNDTRYLADDRLEGRGIGTEGLELAAQHIAQEFERAGLNTQLFNGKPFQEFSRSRWLGMNGPNQVGLLGPDDTQNTWVLKDDFTPLSISGSGNLDLPLVFAGYGITATDVQYDDYANIDVEGKAVVILRHEPQQNDPESPLEGTTDTRHAYLLNKINNAVSHGAAAVILVTDTCTLAQLSGIAEGASMPSENEFAAYDGLLSFRVQANNFERTVPVLHVRRNALSEMILQATQTGLAELEQAIDEQFKPQSRELTGWRLTGETNVGIVTEPLKNVIATLEGSGPTADETIVIGAHYDHLGYGGGWGSLAPWTRDIHNGADDNASGTAVVMELARLLAAREEPFRRRLMFIAFTAEESGLIGSEYYVEHPLVPMDQTVAMFNFDMVGYLRNDRLELYGTGTAAEFDPLLYKLGLVHNLQLIKEPGGYSPSDHATFLEAGVPVLHFFTGFHDYYHRPSDDWDKLNVRGMRRITEMGRDLIVAFADSPTGPTRQVTSEMEMLGVDSDIPRRSSPSRTTWGIEGRMAADGQGYEVIEAARWAAGAKSGIRAGDRILEIGGKPIESAEDYNQALQAIRGGTTVTVVLKRGRFEIEVDVRGG